MERHRGRPSTAELLNRDWFLEFGDQFLEPRVAAQRIPKWVQFQLTIAQ